MRLFAEVAFNLPMKKNFSYSVPEGMEIRIGERIVARFGRKKLTGVVTGISHEPPSFGGEIKSIDRVIDAFPLLDERLMNIARWIADVYMCSLGEAIWAMIPGGKRETSVEDVSLTREQDGKKRFELSEGQKAAAAEILKQRHGAFYLYGITGSGKTEVYLTAAREVLSAGKGVIYLVPEISLTHQVVERFISEFGDAAIIHSGITPSQKLSEWRRLIHGEVSLVIGARSAVFAPVRRLGLIIMDEEHDGSYKSSHTPRFHARQVAQQRALNEKALMVFGSATPSIEAYHRFSTGKMGKYYLGERLAGGKMPDIEIVDMKGTNGSFSAKLIEEMKRVKALGRQTILFLNRRGFAYFFHCRICGFEMKCRHCSVSLTFHKQKWKMICHYCGYSAAPVESCPECGSLDVGYSGFGTEKIEEETSRIFPDFTVRRIDRDTIVKKKALREILTAFRSGEIDVLLGTQMVAKGFNFPKVMLVGIVNADTALHLPDFRSYERTFNLIVQVSGRSGRVIPDGKVIIQTYSPGNEAIVLAAAGRTKDFYESEIEKRRQLGFPPFSRIIRIVFRSRQKAKAEGVADSFADALSDKIDDIAEILGPAECPISLISGNYRIQIILRTTKFSLLHAAVKERLSAFKTSPDVFLEVDVDPISLI